MIKQPTSRTCFMCGRDNESGLKMVWHNNPQSNQVEADVTLHVGERRERNDLARMDDGGVETGLDAFVQEDRVEHVAGGRLDPK